MEKKKVDKSTASVAAMFNDIAPRYDFLNHFLSLGIDKLWRKRLVHMVAKQQPKKILDVATGTGDLAFALQRRIDAQITGVDISEGMLAVARGKVRKQEGMKGKNAQKTFNFQPSTLLLLLQNNCPFPTTHSMR